jgi:hypothetical protein
VARLAESRRFDGSLEPPWQSGEMWSISKRFFRSSPQMAHCLSCFSRMACLTESSIFRRRLTKRALIILCVSTDFDSPW